MKLILMNDDLYKTYSSEQKREIFKQSNLCVNIQNDGNFVIASKYKNIGYISYTELIELVNETISKDIRFTKKHPQFQTYNCIESIFSLENTDPKLEDPELSNSYQGNKIWCIAYDTGFKNIEIVDDIVCLTKKEAENIAKDLCEQDLWKGTELTVVGIPVNNIDYGDTFYSPTDEDSLKDGIVEIPDDLFYTLAKDAHLANMTVTDYANELLKKYIDEKEREKGNHPYTEDELPF